MSKQIIIAISARGLSALDQLELGNIIMDGHVRRLLQRRAQADGTTFGVALEKTLTTAIHKHIEEQS
jgi:hypothetical protein